MKSRLLVIGAVPPPHHGVAISTTLVLANPELGRDFVVQHIDTSDGRGAENIGRLDLQNAWIATRGLFALARRLRGQRGVVYLPLSQGLLAVLRDSLYIRLAAARGWKVAVHLRGGEFREFYEGQTRLARWWILGSLRRINSMAVMGLNLRWIFEGLMPDERIAVVANGTPDLDLDTSKRDAETGLYLSHLRRRKGVVEAIEAALIVLRARPTARFIFAGKSESPEVEQELRSRAREFGDRIEFRGMVAGDSKRDVLARAGYLLFPPVEPEGHPRVVLEAQAAGLPVITTDRGAIAEMVVDGETGFVLDQPVPEELADRILTLLGEPGLRERMGRAARDRHLTHFKQEIADRQLTEWLRDLAPR
jgi:glycosyltransferase involved in cell wall biosynthesis